MVPEVIIAALIIALLLGGKLDRLADAPIKHAWLIAVPVVTYAGSWVLRLSTHLSSSSWAFGALHLISIASLIALCLINVRVPGATFIALGLLLNAIAIASNGGFMPASRDAVGQVFGQAYLAKALSGPHVRSSFIDAGTHFAYLCDIIPKTIGPRVLRGVFSLGDMAMTLGIVISIIFLSRAPDKAGQRAAA